MVRQRVLVVDDEPGMLEVCRDALSSLDGVEIELEKDGRSAAGRLERESWDLLIADIRLPGSSGVELLRLGRDHDPDLAVLMLTGYPTVETAVQSMKLGAADYITKPFLPDNLVTTVRRLLETKRLREEHHFLGRQLERTYAFGEMLGQSTVMRDVFNAIAQVAVSDVEVLILGETGTGKELVARILHRRGSRGKARFVPVDCGAIPDDLLESEFFGHERGAFTGARSRSLGLVEFASRGTLFLDEVGNLPLKLQAKILRALQERRIRRVGGTNEFDVDIRLISATSLDLEEEVRQQRFRADLYYRINVARIELPPLRQRVEDIPLLVAEFTSRYAAELGRAAVEFDPDAIEILTRYAWPGNVRELQNTIKRVLTMSRKPVIRAEDLPDPLAASAGQTPGEGASGFFALRDQHLAALERQLLTQELVAAKGNVTAAAERAGIPRGTMYRLLKKHGVDQTAFR